MSYSLQYQAHVDDLTSLAGNVADFSWFNVQPHEAPRTPTLPIEGFFADDLHSAAAEAPADTSWFNLQPHEAPQAVSLLAEGFFAGDLHSEGGQPDDVSWLVSFPSVAPLAPDPPLLGFQAGDIHSGAAVVPPEDQSWFATFPDEPAVEQELVPQGAFAGDVDSGTAIFWRTIADVFSYDAANHGAALSYYFEVLLLATVGTAHARLYSTTTSAAVSGSELSTTSSTATRLRSGALTLVDANDYHLQIGKQGADAGIAAGAKVITY